MKSWTMLSLAFALLFASASTRANEPLNFPPKGTPYPEARASLLKQGLKIAPDKVEHPDRRFHEVGCEHEQNWTGKAWQELPKINCTALFLEKDARGWRRYVVVTVAPESQAIIDVHYPATVEGLPSIPPPLSADVPQLKGSYLEARKKLRALGFKPARNRQWEPGRFYLDRDYKHFIVMHETECSGTGMGFCNAFWISKQNRVLRVSTIGENRQIYFVEWSTWKELKTHFEK